MPVKGWKGRYEVSNYGSVRSLKKDGKYIYLKQHKYNGYHKVKLIKPEYSKTVVVHRLVAESFIFNSDNKPTVNHKDGNKSNNHVDNLEWCTYKENTRHAIDTGLINFGIMHGSGNIVLDLNTGIYYTTKEASELTGIKYGYLVNMLNGTRKNKTSLRHV